MSLDQLDELLGTIEAHAGQNEKEAVAYWRGVVAGLLVEKNLHDVIRFGSLADFDLREKSNQKR